MKVAVTVKQARFDKFCARSRMPECELVFAQSSKLCDLGAVQGALSADVLFVDAMDEVGPEIIDAMPNLKMIHSEGVAYNRIDVAYAREKGIYVCNAKGANAGQVAEQTILLMLNVLHRFEEGSRGMKAGLQKETQSRFIQEGLHDLQGARVGIVGLGAIGKELAKRLSAFGCSLCYYDPFPANAAVESALSLKRMSLEQLLSESDIVSLHLPLSPDTAGIIDKTALALMKPTAILINTSRGEIVNTKDLADAIKSGIIYGAGLDTISPEPVPKDSPILTLEEPYSYRVALSPHIAGTTLSAFKNMYGIFAENLSCLAAGTQPLTLVP